MNGGESFTENTHGLLKTHGDLLLSIAKSSIEHGLDGGKAIEISPNSLPAELNAKGAVFVTIKKSGSLRGCIGSFEAWRDLVTDICENAYRAAFSDPRFPPLNKSEISDGLNISVSLLSPASPMIFENENNLLAQLKPGVDGLIIEDGPMRALFLPSVWEQLESPEEFLMHLKVKAGMGADHFSPTFRALRFISGETKSDWDDIAPLDFA